MSGHRDRRSRPRTLCRGAVTIRVGAELRERGIEPVEVVVQLGLGAPIARFEDGGLRLRHRPPAVRAMGDGLAVARVMLDAPVARREHGCRLTWVHVARELSIRSLTREMTCCGSNGFTSTPSLWTCCARVSSTGSNAPARSSTGM